MPDGARQRNRIAFVSSREIYCRGNKIGEKGKTVQCKDTIFNLCHTNNFNNAFTWLI